MQVTLFVCLHTCTLKLSCVFLLSWVLLLFMFSDVIRQMCVAVRPGVIPVNDGVDWALKNSYLSIRVYRQKSVLFVEKTSEPSSRFVETPLK